VGVPAKGFEPHHKVLASECHEVDAIDRVADTRDALVRTAPRLHRVALACRTAGRAAVGAASRHEACTLACSRSPAL